MYEDSAMYSGGWNFGPNDEVVLTVKEVVKHVIGCWGGGTYTIDSTNGPHESALLKLDISKARAFLNWKPLYDAYEAVERTVQWYNSFYMGKGANVLYQQALEEIRAYMTRK